MDFMALEPSLNLQLSTMFALSSGLRGPSGKHGHKFVPKDAPLYPSAVYFSIKQTARTSPGHIDLSTYICTCSSPPPSYPHRNVSNIRSSHNSCKKLNGHQ